ncbi:hypothetical protein [Pseudalkalibacillus hwajinpoensis]|uniref:hypothetical protein n=1 Tax=Guptibacillus hwajinpoensis TaxID=208199 RepID=UPI001CFD10F1|nr:hypothetical protein [Pseudalkalibacillus hwajinpoensis]
MKRLLIFSIFLCVIFFSQNTLAVEPFHDLRPIDSEISLLPWEKANEIIPRKAIFTIIDVESGASFRVQRRAGSHHADIQPLTKEDTQILKGIYKEWSWKRRAVIVLHEGRTIAASMNGMPHGAGALDNGFNGHFCLHFLNSTTHKTPTPDPAHQLMILKASGKLDEYLSTSTPKNLVDVMMIALNNSDEFILRRILSKDLTNQDFDSLSRLTVPKWTVQKSGDSPYVQHLHAKVEVYIKDTGVIHTPIKITAKKNPISNRWELEIPNLLKIANH